MDSTWVNGQRVGDSYSVSIWRQYKVSNKIFKPGRNVIAVRVLDTGGPGGLMTPDNQIIYTGTGKDITLTGPWKY